MAIFNMDSIQAAIKRADPVIQTGRVTRASGVIIEATLPSMAVGKTCSIAVDHQRSVTAQVVGFNGNTALLMPFDSMQGIRSGAAVIPQGGTEMIPVGDALLGRVLDANLKPMDNGPTPFLNEKTAVHGRVPIAMERKRILSPISMGIRAIDAFLTVGEGQRVGIFSGAGVGKSVLLGMLARNANADVIILGLVGERGREVREFVEKDLGEEGLARSIVVVATSDEAPLMRIRAALSATALAEHYRKKGKKVLLLLDSLTRVAMAQREIGLAIGEPPTSKGYPPSVFALLPKLLERAGRDSGNGSITALYTVLMEGDDLNDPVADAAKSILDGHFVLSRKLANSGHFPALDILASISRVMNDLVSPEHQSLARKARAILSTYQEASDLIDVGAYKPGSNQKIDQAMLLYEPLNKILRQTEQECNTLEETLEHLTALMGGIRSENA